MLDHATTRANHPAKPFIPAHVAPTRRPLSIPEVAAAARRNILETIPALSYRLPIVSGKTVVRWHMVTDPSALKRVLLDNVDNYPKSKTTQRLLRPAVGTSIFTAEGEEWRWQRRAAAPIFNHRKMVALSPMMTAAAERTAARFDQAIADGFEGGGVVCVMDAMMAAAFEVACDALFAGGRFGGAPDQALDRGEISAALNRYLETIGRVSLLDILDAPHWIPRPAQLLNARVLDQAVEKVDALVAARRAAYDAGERRDDLIDALLAAADPETGRAMDDATLRNNLLSFLIAGHETTALALAWSLYLLANSPEIQDRAADEARAAIGGEAGANAAEASALGRLGYTRQILDEAMRLYPPAAMLGRTAEAQDEIMGREIRPGDTVVLPIYALHRHARLWERPMRFDPENFAPDVAKERDRYAYLPFGAGPRVCIGMNFSLMEATLILATLLARFQFAPKLGPQPEPVLTMTLRPKGGMPLKIRRR